MSNNLKGKLSIGKGDRGDAGLSAYEVAINNGYKGTVEEWLYDLKGEPFIYEDFTPEQLEELKPKKGVDYFDGANGEDGTNGLSAYELWLEEGNSGSIQDFLDSLKGENGEDGKNGVSPEELKEVFAEKIHEHDYAPKEHQHNYSEIGHTHNYAEKDHTHSEFDHEHPEYAPKHHEHQEYALKSEIGAGSVDIEELEGIFAKKEHTHSEFAPKTHEHQEYALTTHNHEEYVLRSELGENEENNYQDGIKFPTETSYLTQDLTKYIIEKDYVIEPNGMATLEFTIDDMKGGSEYNYTKKQKEGITSVGFSKGVTYGLGAFFYIEGEVGTKYSLSGGITTGTYTLDDKKFHRTSKTVEMTSGVSTTMLTVSNQGTSPITVKQGGYTTVEKIKFADISHTHSEYSLKDHTHPEPFKVLTEEEYTELSEEEKMNGVIYFVY